MNSDCAALVGPKLAQSEFTSLVNFSLRQWTGTYQLDPSWWHSGLEPAQTEAGIDEYFNTVANQLPNAVASLGGVIGEVGANAAADAAFSTELRSWVDATVPGLLADLDQTISPLQVDPAVSIAPVAGAAAGQTVTLAVDLPVDYVADVIRWDLDGDGAFDDATGASPTWTVPGDLRAGVPIVIAVEVVGGLTTDVAYEVVIPGAGNQPPTITQVAPNPSVGVPGVTTTFEVAVSDPEGGAVQVEWFVENAPTGVTGTTFDYPVPADFWGGVNVTAVATDEDGGSSATGFLLRVLSEVDADGDGFFAFPGPDCGDVPNTGQDPNVQGGVRGSQINQLRGEIVGNNVDDDCDPATPDSGTPINPSRPSPRAFSAIEGDVFQFVNANWGHPNRNADQPFTITVEWGDGTTSTQTVQGTTRAETTFDLSHQYVDELIDGDLRWCISNGADPDGCGEELGAIEIDNDQPFVGSADLRTWLEDDAIQNPDQCVSNNPSCVRRGDWVIGADGRTALSTLNPGEYYVLHSPVDLAEGGYGRGMAEFSVLAGGDDDNLGLLLGYDAGDIVGSTGAEDFVDFEWTGRSRTRQSGESATSPNSCRGATDAAPQDDLADTATISRTRGPAISHERNYNVVVNAVGATSPPDNPLCTDAFGVDELAVLDLAAAGLDVPNAGHWRVRAVSADRRGSGRADLPYVFTVDYRPDRLQMWAQDGTLVADVAPRDPVNDPFPPGGLAVSYWSQRDIRAKATAPEPGFTFVQGTEGSITMPFTDGGDDEWLAVVDWGDGSSQSTGTITADAATGTGWYDVAASHTYLRAGEYRGEVCVVDDLVVGSCFTFRATVDNLPPVVEAGPDIVDEPDLVSGATLSLEQATFTDPGTNDDHTATIDWGDGTIEPGSVASSRSTGGVVTGTHTYAADGIYQVEVCVTDQAGGTGCDTLDVDVRVTNQPPVAAVQVPDTDELINAEVVLGGGFTDPNPDDTHTMTIDPGDGSGIQALSFQAGRQTGVGSVGTGGIGHVYTVPGTYTVTSCVTDAAGETDCASADVVVLDDGTFNDPPTVDPGGPYVVDEGSTITLDASGSSDPEGEPVTIAWDTDGDGSFETPGATLEVSAPDGPASRSIDLEVCDVEGLCATGTAVVQIAGVAPTVTLLDVVIEGLAATATVRFTDPGLADTHTVVVDWGDGSTPAEQDTTDPGGATITATHLYQPGSWIVTATVTDDDGDVGSETTQVVVTPPNLPPVADAGGPYTVSEGSTTTLDGSGSSDPEGEPVTVAWDLDGDGTFGDGALFTGVEGPATRTVTIRACDPSGACDVDDAVVSVTNVAPMVDPATVSQDGADVTVDVTFADPGQADTHTVVIDWGDGSTPFEQNTTTPGGGTATGSRTYEPGTWDGTVTVTDDDGGVATTGFQVVVADPNPGSPCETLEPTIVGTARRDVLIGTHGPDVIFGLGGNDLILGLGGDDVLCGGPGNDKLYGSWGDDVLEGGDGNDHLFGWKGDDILTGDDGNDRLYGSFGDDVLTGDDGNDKLYGGKGDDVLTGGAGNDLLDGGWHGWWWRSGDAGDGGDGHDICSGLESATNCEAGRRRYVAGWRLHWFCDIDWILGRHHH